MNATCRIASWLLAFVLATFAATVPAAAATPAKQFSIAALPGIAAPGSTQLYTLTIKNEVPNGNSNFNSITINLPSGFSLNTSAANGGGPVVVNWSYTPPLILSATSVSIQNMSPVKPQQSFTMTLYATAPAAMLTSCAQWTGTAYAGSQLNGDTFAQIGTSVTGVGTQYVSNSNPLTMSFASLPSSVVTNPPQTTPYSITVTLSNACTGTPPNGAVTLASTGGSITGGGTQNTTNGSTTFSVSFLSVGQTTITASSPGFVSTQAALNVFGGTLACLPNKPFSFDGSLPSATLSDPGYASGQRGQYNKDGPCSQAVNYTFTNGITLDGNDTNDFVQLHWDTVAQPGAAFTYTVNWDAVAIDPTTGYPPPLNPQVTWQFDASGNPINLRPALACLDRTLPMPYGTLASANLGADDGTITISLANPPVVSSPGVSGFATFPGENGPSSFYPFPVMVGNERMQVTAVSNVTASGATFTVSRHQGGTLPNATSPIGNDVMSTPLPIDSANAAYLGTVAQMCVVNQGWMTYSPDPTTGAPRAVWFTTLFDIGDGYVKGSY
jgi:hypothetical protein